MSRPGEPQLRVGIIPLPDFTMLAFAGFIDALRLAADEGDRSRPLRCRWTVMSEGRLPVRASNGVSIQSSADLLDAGGFDYLVVVGGLLHEGPRETPELLRYLASADGAGVPLAGLCTGSFTLARAGLMEGRRACVSWFHHEEFRAEFPRIPVVSDRLFLDDGRRITCAGGASVIHLASHLIERHLGPGSAAKGIRIMIEEAQRAGSEPQPAPGALPETGDPRVRRALLEAERRMAERVRLVDLARAAGVSPRQLTRLFLSAFAMTPAAAVARLRLERAAMLVERGGGTLADIAAECGFTDASHLVRRWRAAHGAPPRAGRSGSKVDAGATRT